MRELCLALAWVFFSLSGSAQQKSITPLPAAASAKAGAATYAVVIGISDYQDKDIPDLRFADKDALAFANFLRSPAGGSLDDDHLKLMTNDQATAGRIAEALDGLIEQAKEGDQVIIYFSGHGDVERKTISQPGFLLAWDAPTRVYMGGGTYSLAFLQEVTTTLSTQNKAKVIIITDACHAGKLAGNQIGGAQLTSANLAKQYANEVKILSCQPNEYSLEGEQWGGGRGAFSYHLLDGLLGLADRNGDGVITVGEIDRYLEDHVTAEAAPQSQVPMLLGSKTEQLATVNSGILAALKKAKSADLPVLAATDSRGFEEEVLAKVDSSIREKYRAFKLAVQEKRFFPNASASKSPPSADELYALLSAEPGLAPLHGIMKRNYAAGLQDDAQQAINIGMNADVKQLEYLKKIIPFSAIPRQLERAAALLGEAHYMYAPLKARQYLFEGINEAKHENMDAATGRRCIALFQKSLSYEPYSPLPWRGLSLSYAQYLQQFDSAFVCAQEARNLAPNWVLPYAYLYHYFINRNKFDLAEKALDAAKSIQPDHPYVLKGMATYQMKTGKIEEALASFEAYLATNGPTYPSLYADYGTALKMAGRMKESEIQFKKALALDSTEVTFLTNLGQLYSETKRNQEAEQMFLKALALDSTNDFTHHSLGVFYLKTNRPEEARRQFFITIELDPNAQFARLSLAAISYTEGKTAEAIGYVEQAIAKGITFEQLEKDQDLFHLRALPEWKALMKKDFPDKIKD